MLPPSRRALRSSPRLPAALLAAAVLLAGCDALTPSGKERDGNVAPNVQLADNVPIQNDTLSFSQAELFWDGGDSDGFITGYQYRTFTQYCKPECEPFSYQDSASGTWDGWTPEGPVDDTTGWTSTSAISDTLTFDSQAPLNRQLFQVRSIDDAGAISPPTPASSRYFYTPNSSPPRVTIATPQDGAQRFGLHSTNDWWKGVVLTYDGRVLNEEKEIVEFGWRLNKNEEWNWTPDTSAVLTPNVLMQDGSLYGEHTAYLTARDNTGLVSHEGEGTGTDSVTFRVVEPAFRKDLLIIDETDESAGGGNSINRTGFTDADVDAAYMKAFGSLGAQELSVDQWDYKAEGGAPLREILGRYRAVLWHSDDYSVTQHLPDHADLISSYMAVGGDFMMSGARLFSTLADVGLSNTTGGGQSVPLGEDSFLRKYLHVRAAKETDRFNDAADFGGVTGLGSFSDATRSKEKVPGSTFFRLQGHVGLIQIGTAIRAPFSESIYAYQNLRPESDWGGQVVGVRYYGTVFDTIALGFPMWYMRDEDLTAMGHDMLRSIRDGD